MQLLGIKLVSLTKLLGVSAPPSPPSDAAPAFMD